MLKLLSLLAAGMFLTFLIGGKDYGQMRQGLVGVSQNPAERPVLRQAKAVPAAPAKPAPKANVKLASSAPAKAQQPAKATSTIAGDFVLSAPEKVAAVKAAPAPAVPETAPIMYISSRSVNVRQGPSTDYEVVGRLVRAEAVSVISPEENGWVRIAIEGDGLEGYIAARLLSDTDPSGN
ncbi:SH3 domain-containing protein [Pseudorhodobacter sp. W20_MBD10_FR17]|uniref:SH3 domain-containing protein n=1 Tax=Pseudorhodobacter sp. W20_MBD10_FR17 TaxID=3240266 RepID=UPI003F98E992